MSKPLLHVTQEDGSVNDPSAPLLTWRKPRNRSRRTTGVVICLIAVFIAVLLIGVGVGGYFGYEHFFDNKVHKCIIPGACNSKVFAYIDSSVDPCDDFYQYSCGNWLANTFLDGRNEWGTFYALAYDTWHQLDRYLNQSVNASDSEAIKKSKYIFSACTNSTFIQHKLLNHLRSFITAAGGWKDIGMQPEDEWDFSNLVDDHYLGSPAYFAFDIQPDDLNSSKPIIKIRHAGLSFITPDTYNDKDSVDELILTIKQLISELAGNFTADYKAIATGIVEYEKSLAQYWLTEAELRNLSLLYNPLRLRELSELFSMDWVNYFNTFFSKARFSGGFTEESVVIVETLNYFKSFNFTVTDDAINYAKWQLLVNELSFATAVEDFDWDIFHKLKYPKSSKLGASNDNLPCVELVEQSMPLAVARPFVEEFITTDLINTVNETANQIEKAFVQRVMKKDWLDQTTKEQCADKVNAITRQIAYPDFIKIDSELDKFYEKLDINKDTNFFEIGAAIRNFQTAQMVSSYGKPTDKTQWLDAPTEVNAYYSPQFNQFVFLAGILRPPFIAADWPPFLLYGAFGVVTGHELTHGFDDQGQQFDKNGNRVKWWTDKSARQFQNRTQCFVDQYDQYSLLGYKINGELTLGENIADNGGVHTAYHAYKNVMNGTKAQSYGGHTEDQLFFVSFAQLYCSLFTGAALEKSTKTDPHSPGPIRVLGSLVNSEEFTKAFQCSKDSKMYPSDDRCELW